MGIKISNLPDIVTPNLTDVFPVVQGGTSFKETISQLISLIGVGITSINQNSSTTTLTNNFRYIINNGSNLVTLTYPVSPAIGDTYYIVGGSSGGWIVAQLDSQQTHVGSSATTAGVAGSVASSNQYDCITITCIATNTFTAFGLQGSLTIV